MSKPGVICSKCSVPMPVTFIGVEVIFYASDPPVPYEVWTGDERTCPICGATIISNWADNPCAVQYRPEEMKALLERLDRLPHQNRVDVFERGHHHIRTNEFQARKYLWGLTVDHFDPDTFEVDPREIADLAIRHFGLWSKADKEFINELADRVAREHNLGE